MDARDSLFLLDLDKGKESLGPLFEEPRRRLESDPKLRAAWSQYQALRALAWEDAPDLDQKLIRQALQASRRQEVVRRLARSTGSEDAARDLLLSSQPKERGLPAWGALLLLVLALGLGWIAFRPGLPLSIEPAPTEPMSFEFSAQAPAAALQAGDAAQDETKTEDPNARAARQMLREHLQAGAEPTVVPREPALSSPKGPTRKMVQARPAPTKAAMAAAPTKVPTAAATETLRPSATAQPTLATTATIPDAGGAQGAPPAGGTAAVVEGPGLALSANELPCTVTLSLPEAGSVDLRLFDMRGRLVRRYAEKEAGPGAVPFQLDDLDEQGQSLPRGTYYLRAMTRWFSKVEALEKR